jgi:hypothetical protein
LAQLFKFILQLFRPGQANTKPHAILKLILYRKHPSGGDAYFVFYGNIIQLCGIDLFVELNPYRKSSLWPACFGSLRKIFGYGMYILLIIALQGLTQLAEMVFIPAAFQEAGYRFLRNGRGRYGMNQF